VCRTGVLVVIYSIRFKQILCKYDNAMKIIFSQLSGVCTECVQCESSVCRVTKKYLFYNFKCVSSVESEKEISFLEKTFFSQF